MSKHYSSEISTDEDGNVSITFDKNSWAKFIELWAQTAHMNECALTAWKSGNPEAALIYYDRMSNIPMARLHAIAPEEVHTLVAEARETTSEGK